MFRARAVFALLPALLAMSTIYAQAQQKPAPAIAPVQKPPAATPAKPSRFDEIDTNHDGFVSREEFLAAQKKQFDTFDTNHDGKLDAKEVASSPPLMERNLEMANRMIKQWDANGDGIVTAEEYKQFSEKKFTQLDKDGTGKIARPTPPVAPLTMPPKAQNADPSKTVQLHVEPKH